MSRLLLALLCAAPLAASAQSVRPASGTQAPDLSYKAIPLNSPENAQLWGAALNNAGQVAGYAIAADGHRYPFVGSKGYAQLIYGLPGSDVTSLNDNATLLLNGDHGIVTVRGSSVTPVPMPNSGYSHAKAINKAGQVVATAADADDQSSHAYLYTPGSGRNGGVTLGAQYRASEAYALNDAGSVVGTYIYDANIFGGVHGFLYANGQFNDLGTLGGKRSEARAVNNNNVAVGLATAPDNLLTHAVMFINGKAIALGELPGTDSSVANGINDAGDIVGDSSSASGVQLPFLYRNGVMVDLNTLIPPTSGLRLTTALAINQQHQILVQGFDNTGEYGTAVLSPVANTASPMPMTPAPGPSGTQ